MASRDVALSHIRNLTTTLLAMRNVVHMLHLQTESYERHLAFGKLYEVLESGADTIAEMTMGRYGRWPSGKAEVTPFATDPNHIVPAIIKFLEGEGQNMVDVLDNLAIDNEYQSLVGEVYRVAYMFSLK